MDADEEALAEETHWLAGKAENNFLVLKNFLGRSSGATSTRKELREKAAGLTGVVADQYRDFFDRQRWRHLAHRPNAQSRGRRSDLARLDPLRGY